MAAIEWFIEFASANARVERWALRSTFAMTQRSS